MVESLGHRPGCLGRRGTAPLVVDRSHLMIGPKAPRTLSPLSPPFRRVLAVSDVADGPFDRQAARSDTDSRSRGSSSAGGNGSSAAVARKRGLSRLRVFGAMKVCGNGSAMLARKKQGLADVSLVSPLPAATDLSLFSVLRACSRIGSSFLVGSESKRQQTR